MHKLINQLHSLADGNCKALCLNNNGNVLPFGDCDAYTLYRQAHCSYYVLPTSANPLHKGHLHMANHVESIRELDDTCVEFELSMTNVDKHGSDVEEMYEKLKQFMHLGRKCWITNFTTFAQKAHFFQDVQFIIGVDTVNRLVDPAYYFDCEEERDKVMYDIVCQNCRFLVFSRSGYTIDPYCLKMTHLFCIEEYDGYDISSSQIREDIKVNDGFYRDKAYDQRGYGVIKP